MPSRNTRFAGSDDDDDAVDAGLLTALANRAAASQAARTATPGSVGGGSQLGSQQTSQQVGVVSR